MNQIINLAVIYVQILAAIPNILFVIVVKITTIREIKMEQKEFLLQFFKYGHLPDDLQKISRPFSVLAEAIIEELPKNPERTVALRKLLEAKDCAVRAFIAKG